MVNSSLNTERNQIRAENTIMTLQRLLDGDFSIVDYENRIKGFHDGGSAQFAVVLGDPSDVHLSHDIAAQSFDTHGDAAGEYFLFIQKHLQREPRTDWVDSKTRNELLSLFGRPPAPSHPIYFISTEVDEKKDVVYVGRTAAEDGRFVGGHRAISKLHDPRFDGTKKKVYMAYVLARISASEWINIELVQPRELANFYLSEVELNLIYALQPILNEKGTQQRTANVEYLILVNDTHGLIKDTDGIHCVR